MKKITTTEKATTALMVANILFGNEGEMTFDNMVHEMFYQSLKVRCATMLRIIEVKHPKIHNSASLRADEITKAINLDFYYIPVLSALNVIFDFEDYIVKLPALTKVRIDYLMVSEVGISISDDKTIDKELLKNTTKVDFLIAKMIEGENNERD